jgi:hypothetical protein
MILKIIIAGIIIYYLILFWWLIKKRRKMPLQKEEINHEKRSIIGESTFRLRQVTSYKATERQFSKGVNNTSTFALQDTEDTPLPIDVEFEMVFEEHARKEKLEFDDSDIALSISGEGQSARGISFEEMAQAVRVIHQDESPEEEERKALQTLAVMQQTSLYDTVIEQINGGMVRVVEMLGKYDAVFIAPPNETSPEDLQAFDMNDYM